jgi:hypothetical protein
MTTFKAAITGLKQHRKQLLSQLRETDKALWALRGLSSKKAGSRPVAGRIMSKAGRARIVAAQRARWAKFRKEKKRANRN